MTVTADLELLLCLLQCAVLSICHTSQDWNGPNDLTILVLLSFWISACQRLKSCWYLTDNRGAETRWRQVVQYHNL